MSKDLFSKTWAGVAMASVLLGIPASAQAPQSAEMARIRSDAAKAGPVSIWVVTQEFTGSFESVAANSEKVKQEAVSQKIAAGLTRLLSPAASTQPLAILILPEDPTGKSEFRMSIGFTVPARVAVHEPLKIEHITYPAAFRHTHTGPFQELAGVYHGMNEARAVNWPVVLRVLDDPERVPAEFIRTEVIAPVK
jgi:hypothetical protein